MVNPCLAESVPLHHSPCLSLFFKFGLVQFLGITSFEVQEAGSEPFGQNGCFGEWVRTPTHIPLSAPLQERMRGRGGSPP